MKTTCLAINTWQYYYGRLTCKTLLISEICGFIYSKLKQLKNSVLRSLEVYVVSKSYGVEHRYLWCKTLFLPVHQSSYVLNPYEY